MDSLIEQPARMENATASATPKMKFEMKEFAILIPTVGSALAILFEAGSFIPIGGQAFEQFTLADHLVIALRALPLAMCAAALLVLIYAMFHSARSPYSRIAKSIASSKFWYYLSPFAELLLSAALAFIAIRINSALIFGIAAASVGWRVFWIILAPTDRNAVAVRAIASICYIGLLTTLLGADLTTASINSNSPLNTIETRTEALHARVVRANDRVVLLYLPDKRRYLLLPTGEIRSNSWPATREGFFETTMARLRRIIANPKFD